MKQTRLGIWIAAIKERCLLDGYYKATYSGVGVHIDMVDTGIQSDHKEFLTADSSTSKVVSGGYSYDGTNNTEDCEGHGTATASLAAGISIGSAPNATLHAIRACACDAVDINIDACSASLGSSAYVETVGAAQIENIIAPYTSTRKCINLYAPGTQVYCANIASSYQRITCTSMACPIVSGIIAQYLEYNKTLTTYDVTDTLYGSHTRGNVMMGRGDVGQRHWFIFPHNMICYC